VTISRFKWIAAQALAAAANHPYAGSCHCAQRAAVKTLAMTRQSVMIQTDWVLSAFRRAKSVASSFAGPT
jgi:hypothetical protein